jgi:hypothetical protein
VNNRWKFFLFITIPTVAFLLLPLIDISLEVKDADLDTLLNILLCLVGVAMTVLAISFGFSKSILFDKNSKMFFIDVYGLLVLEILFALFYKFKNAFFPLLIIIFIIIFQLYIIFHYYFKSIFDSEDLNKDLKSNPRYFYSIMNWIFLCIPIYSILISLQSSFIYYLITGISGIYFALIKELYLEKTISKNNNLK